MNIFMEAVDIMRCNVKKGGIKRNENPIGQSV